MADNDPLNTPDAETVSPTPPIVKKYQDIHENQTLASDLMKEFTAWVTWRQPLEDLWNKIYRMFFNRGDELKTTTRAKIFIPVVFQVIEAALPKVMNVLFGNEEFFDTIADQKKDTALAEVIHLLLIYQLGQADFVIKYVDFAKQLLLYGTSYFKVYWKVVRKWVWERTPIRKSVSFLGIPVGSRIVGWKEEKVFKVTERRPEVEVLDVLDVFPDPNAQTEQEGAAVWIRSWISYDELLQLSKGEYPVYMNIPAKSELGDRNKNFSVTRGIRQSTRGTSTAPASIDTDRYEILERWGLKDLDDDGIQEETLITILDGKYVIRADENPFHHQKRPLIKSVLFSVPKEWFGIGLVEPVIPLVHELNTLRRQRLDNINLAINSMWSVNAFADIELGTVVSTPGGILLRGDNPNDIMRLPIEDVTDSAYTEASVVQTDIENTTAPKAMQGTPSSGSLGRTARGAQMIIGQALEKFGLVTRILEETSIKKTLRFFHQLNLQFIDDDEVFQETGYYGGIFDQKVTPEMIRADVQFKMLGISEMVNKEAKINQAISFMGIFGKALSPITISAVAKKVWKLMGFNEDEIVIMAQQPIPPDQTDPDNNPNLTQNIQGQVQSNGASASPAVPGANSIGMGQ